MDTQYDQLTKLKGLLDAGTLTQKEFDAAKQRVLNEEASTNSPSTSQEAPASNDINATESKSTSTKWIWWGVVGLLAVIFLFILAGNNTDDSQINIDESPGWEAAKAEADAQFEEVLANAAEMNGDDDGLSLGNPWRKDYFHNEWGEDMPEHPYIYTTLSGSAWNIHIGYESAQSTGTASGVFGLYIMDDDYRKTSMLEPVNILVRGSDGETKIVPVTAVNNGVAYIADPETVEGLKAYLNSEQFDILMEFDKYNERHQTKARWDYPGFFQEAIDKML